MNYKYSQEMFNIEENLNNISSAIVSAQLCDEKEYDDMMGYVDDAYSIIQDLEFCLSNLNNKMMQEQKKSKMSLNEAHINVIMETLDEAITIPAYQEDQVKEKIRKALRIIEEKEAHEPTG